MSSPLGRRSIPGLDRREGGGGGGGGGGAGCLARRPAEGGECAAPLPPLEQRARLARVPQRSAAEALERAGGAPLGVERRHGQRGGGRGAAAERQRGRGRGLQFALQLAPRGGDRVGAAALAVWRAGGARGGVGRSAGRGGPKGRAAALTARLSHAAAPRSRVRTQRTLCGAGGGGPDCPQPGHRSSGSARSQGESPLAVGCGILRWFHIVILSGAASQR